jgi:hypothetical protein
MADWEGLGLESGTVEVVPYDPRWVTLFRQAELELRQSLGEAISDVHHVGSTSVPGLCAKPILDMLVSISDFERGVSLVPTLERLGYEHRGLTISLWPSPTPITIGIPWRFAMPCGRTRASLRNTGNSSSASPSAFPETVKPTSMARLRSLSVF